MEERETKQILIELFPLPYSLTCQLHLSFSALFNAATVLRHRMPNIGLKIKFN
jgi:hypothetical protein